MRTVDEIIKNYKNVPIEDKIENLNYCYAKLYLAWDKENINASRVITRFIAKSLLPYIYSSYDAVKLFNNINENGTDYDKKQVYEMCLKLNHLPFIPYDKDEYQDEEVEYTSIFERVRSKAEFDPIIGILATIIGLSDNSDSDDTLTELEQFRKRRIDLFGEESTLRFLGDPYFKDKSNLSKEDEMERKILFLTMINKGSEFKYIPPKFAKDREVVIKAFEANNNFYQYMDESLKDDFEMNIYFSKNVSCFINDCLHPSYWDNDAIALEAVLFDSDNFGYVSNRLKNDKNFILRIFKCDHSSCGYRILKMLDSSFLEDDEILLAAIKNTYLSISSIDKKYINRKDFVLKVISLFDKYTRFKFKHIASFINYDILKDEEVHDKACFYMNLDYREPLYFTNYDYDD